MNLLCRIGIHKWKERGHVYWGLSLPPTTRWACERCGKSTMDRYKKLRKAIANGR
jgi:hypothetical protein